MQYFRPFRIVHRRRSIVRIAARSGAILLMTCGPLATLAFAQPKTDIVTLANGDRITGEISALERGQLEFKTDDAGTLYLEWDKLVSLVAATRLFEVVTSDGRRFLGGLDPGPVRSV